MSLISELESAIRAFDAQLKPVANRPVDITEADWLTKLQSLDPLEEAGIDREEIGELVLKLVRAYDNASAQERQEIRDLYDRHRAFAWAATLPLGPTSLERWRQHLLLFSIQDQGQDSRDAILHLQHLCAEAAKSTVDIRPILREVAALSSDRDKYGMGSTQEHLLNASRGVSNPSTSTGWPI